jgi:hypothetical protein
MIGSKLATMVATVMTLGRSRKRAPLQSGNGERVTASEPRRVKKVR